MTPSEPRPKSLKERIITAATLDELNQLLALGDSYDQASEDTRAQWRAKARKRRAELEAGK